MKRRGSAQIALIIVTVLIIAGIVFALFKFGIIEKDPMKTEPSEDIIEGTDDEENNIADTENIDEEEDQEYNDQDHEEIVEDEEVYDIEIGKEAPNFTLNDLEGNEVSLEDYRDKIVLINFWATWCGYCDEEMPDMQKLSDENDDLVILAIDVREEKDLVKDYIDEGGYDFEVLLDKEGYVSETYLVSAFPTSYFVGKDGILLGGVPGMMTGPQMNGIIENIRKGE